MGHKRGSCIAHAAGAATGNGKVAQNGKLAAGTGFRNANFPVDGEGRTYHLGTKVSAPKRSEEKEGRGEGGGEGRRQGQIVWDVHGYG